MPAESVDEFELIRSLFAPLAVDPGARGLLDDVAVISPLGRVVVTTDAIVEGVHFLASDPIETVAMKALRVNVSDLIAKGARPMAAMLTLVWPKARAASEMAAFAQAFGRDLQQFGVALLGGDLTVGDGPLTISITALGEPLGDHVPSRAEARPGEDVWLVGGEIGSAWLGLQLRTGALGLAELRRGRGVGAGGLASELQGGDMPAYLVLPGEPFDTEAAWLMSTYLAPFVRPECAAIVARYASASMDISDGLVADARKLAAASGVALRLEANEVPLSIPGQRWAQTGGDFRKLITGGDDYVVLFTAPEASRAAIASSEDALTLRLGRVGKVEPGSGVTFVDRAGTPILLPETGGYAHRLDR